MMRNDYLNLISPMIAIAIAFSLLGSCEKKPYNSRFEIDFEVKYGD